MCGIRDPLPDMVGLRAPDGPSEIIRGPSRTSPIYLDSQSGVGTWSDHSDLDGYGRSIEVVINSSKEKRVFSQVRALTEVPSGGSKAELEKLYTRESR